MKRAQTTPQTIAALHIVVSVAVAELAEAGGPVTPEWHRALGLVEASLRGEAKKKDLVLAQNKMFRISDKHDNHFDDPLQRAAGWLSDAIGKLLAAATGGKDLVDLILTHTSYGMPGKDSLARHRKVQARFADAKKRVAKRDDIDSTPIPEPKRRVDPRAAAALASVMSVVDAPIAALFRRKKAERDPKKTTTRAELVALLAKRGYKAHPAVLDFEARYGGLIVPESGDDDWIDEGTYAMFGAFAFFKSQKPKKREDDLVPIAIDSRGNCYMDAKGRVFGEDEIEGMMPGVFAKNGDSIVARLTLASYFEEKISRRRFRKMPKGSGARVAKVIGAKRVPSASKPGEAWWASEAFIVFQTRKEVGVCALDDESAKKLPNVARRI